MSRFEFSAEIVERTTNGLVVSGRCLAGSFRIGSTFLAAYRIADVHDPNSAHVDECGVQLRVERIVAYRRDLDEVDSGLTAMLDLSGNGGELVQSGMVIGGD